MKTHISNQGNSLSSSFDFDFEKKKSIKMHNTYITSCISLKTKGSLLSSSSFNDRRSYYLRSDRFDTTPLLLCHSSCCNCCACCGFNQRVLINSSFVLYGLRQSSLVQLGHCRRMVLGCGDQCYNRVPVCRAGGDSYGVSCLVEESRVVDGTRRRLKGSFGIKDLKERRKIHCSSGENEAEVMLSLLIEETGEESFDSYKKVKVEKRENVGDHGHKKKKNNREIGSLQSDSKFVFESARNKSREEGYRRNVKKNERSSRVENRIARTEGSYGSSYYSCASDDDFESKMEAKSNNEEHIVDTSNVHTSNNKKFGRSSVEIERGAKLESARDDKEKRQEVSTQQFTVGGSYTGGSNVNWDLRKKSEKKLSEVSMDKTEKLNLVENSNQELKRRISCQKIGESTAIINYRQDTEAITEEDKHHNSQKVYSTDAQIFSNSQKQFLDREEDVRTAVNLVQQRRNTAITEEDKHHNSQKNYSTDAQIISNSQKQFHDREEDVHTAVNLVQQRRNTVKDEQRNTLQRQSEIRLRKQEENLTSISSSVQDMAQDKLYKTGEVSAGQVGSRRNSVQINDESYHYDEKYSTSRWQLEDRMKKREERLPIISSLRPESKQPHSHTDISDGWRSEQRIGSHDVASSSVVHVSDTEKVTSSTSITKSKMGSQDSYIISSDGHNQTDEMQIGLSKQPQKLIQASSFHESTSKEASQSRLQESRVQDRDTRSSQAILMPPPPQLVETEEASSNKYKRGSSSIYVYPQREDSASHGIVYGGDEGSAMHGEAVSLVSPDDALGSADRLEKSSMQFVGDFVKRIRHEVSTSEILKDNLFSKTKLEHKNDKEMEERESKLSSRASETQEPSDEKWDVAESSVQEIPKTETHTPEGFASTGSTIARRNSKSLWSVVADIVRFKWATHSQNHTTQTKSSVKSSSNESVSSEAWFSGREPELSDQSAFVKAPMINQEEPDLGKAKEEISYPSSSFGLPETGSTSLGMFVVPGEENLSPSGNGARIEGTPSSSTIIHTSFPLSFRQLRRSPAVDVISSTGKNDSSESGLMEQYEPPQSVRSTEGKDGELKRRKLQRNSQVPKDRFDEWEEAYMHESELRKLDEMFMQEALIEARKAADTWEVPVGAVLVQHGKIIARGFNLVEELRDSTAHAEMICIREASNVLKSWRLADTTLYVTLEPCPMCAGAILQARVDTVVWGAPNKLLGADGSWIRLFPNGGESGSEQTDKPPPPVHPFHPNMKVRRGVLANECADIMQQFFQLRRKKKSPDPPTPPSSLHISHHPSKIISKMHGLFNVMFCL